MDQITGDYPFEIKDLSSEERNTIFKYFSNSLQDGYVRVGQKGYLFPNGFRKEAVKIYNMPLRSDDTWVVTFPKSGTTWVQEMTWIIANDFDCAKAEAVPLVNRFPFLEMSIILNGDKGIKFMRELCGDNDEGQNVVNLFTKSGTDIATGLPSPRFIKSHLPLSLLPPTLLDSSKVVYVARDPRDVMVSYYHHDRNFKFMGYTGDLREFCELFIKDSIEWNPYFDHVKEAWEKRHHPNLLFLFYEEILADLPAAVLRVADFLGKPVTNEQLDRACQHLSFENFKNNMSVNFDVGKQMGWYDKNAAFVRSGKAGGWRTNFDEQMSLQVEKWMDENLRNTDLAFPVQTHKYNN